MADSPYWAGDISRFCNSLYAPRHCDVSARSLVMKLRFLMPVVFAGFLTGCPDGPKKVPPSAATATATATASVPASASPYPSPSPSASAAPVADASVDDSPADAGKVADAGKTAPAAPKK